MLTVLLIFLMIIDVLAIAFTWLWRRTDWAALDEANSAFIDSENGIRKADLQNCGSKQSNS